MERSEIEATVREVMAGLFGLEESEIDADTSMNTVEAWDSLQHVTLVMSLEQALGVQLPVEAAFAMTSFGKILETVAQYKS
ncbi:MAG: acyl carrier protein [Phycisphaerae bacterium]